MFDFNGKKICIIGGAGYLGSSVCRGFLNRQAEILICDVNLQRLSKLKTELESEYPDGKVSVYTVDIGEKDSTEYFFLELEKKKIFLDTLINATYAASGKPFSQIEAAEFDRINHINITSAFTFLKQAIPFMKSGSSIVLFSSMYGTIPPNYNDYPEGLIPNPVDYGVGKAAVNQLTRYFATFCGKQNIRVNAIAPGAFPFCSAHAGNEEFIKRLSEKSMLCRIGSPEEITGPVIFLSSDEASFITGQVLSVDGGVTAW